ncbi:MAG: helix-turn-helix domain-containing protein [Clostridia bacterium]|nr:helix-turn-helix domain-containing protein [Clostridia bacterium]
MLRTNAGISQKQLADIINVSQQSINKYENHEVEPNIETLSLIADFFDVSIDYLVGRTDIMRRYESVKEYDLNTNEQNLIDLYRKLSANDKAMIMSFVSRLENNSR